MAEEKKARPPIVGEAVQYRPSGNKEPWCAATIVKVYDDGLVALHVLRADYNSADWPDGVAQGEGPNNWRRIPRGKGE